MMWLTIPAFFLAGVAGWSFTEYAMHNWWGHWGKGRNRFSREHLAHHANVKYFAPTAHKLQAAAAATALIAPLTCWVLGWPGGVAFTVGFLCTYGAYEFLHRRIHTHAPVTAYGRWARKHHLVHHFTRPSHNHGVTSPIWDYVFRTHEEVGQVRVPRKKPMVWLCDESGAVKPEYATDYVLVGRPAAARKQSATTAPAAAVAATP
jgi:sterol desaturase/sphingolipid hydroxylase (fatty acid hydroxylase superfamily)